MNVTTSTSGTICQFEG